MSLAEDVTRDGIEIVSARMRFAEACRGPRECVARAIERRESREKVVMSGRHWEIDDFNLLMLQRFNDR